MRSRRRARNAGPRIRRDLRAAGADFRRAGRNVREAGANALDAGQAGMEAARDLADVAGTRMSEATSEAGRVVEQATETARERATEVAAGAGRTAAGLGTRLFHLPALVRRSARRSRKAVEAAGTRAVVSVLDAGTRAINVAAEYVGELASRRRVERSALEELVVEQLQWAHAATEAYDRSVNESDDAEMRMQLVRYKMQTIKQAEALGELLREIGGRVPTEERTLPAPSVPARNAARARRAAAARQGLAHLLTIAMQSTEGWRALNRIASAAEQDRIADALLRANQAVGSEPEQQVTFLGEALLEKTVESVLA